MKKESVCHVTNKKYFITVLRNQFITAAVVLLTWLDRFKDWALAEGLSQLARNSTSSWWRTANMSWIGISPEPFIQWLWFTTGQMHRLPSSNQRHASRTNKSRDFKPAIPRKDNLQLMVDFYKIERLLLRNDNLLFQKYQFWWHKQHHYYRIIRLIVWLKLDGFYVGFEGQ